MFDVSPSTATAAASRADVRHPFGPEGRSAEAIDARQWLAATLDEIDYGMLLLRDGMRLIHANHAARAELAGAHPLLLTGKELHVRRPDDVLPLSVALKAAARHGLRKMLTLGEESHRVTMSIVPLSLPDGPGAPVTLLMLGRLPGSEALSVHNFARSHSLTAAEARVLAGLCRGTLPQVIAKESGVAISTVRSHIGSIRRKTGAASICALVQQVAALPPLLGVLRGLAGGTGRTVLND